MSLDPARRSNVPLTTHLQPRPAPEKDTQVRGLPPRHLSNSDEPLVQTDTDTTDSESEVEKALFDLPGMRVRTLTGNSTQAKEGSTPMDEATAEASVPKEDDEVRVHLSLDSGRR